MYVSSYDGFKKDSEEDRYFLDRPMSRAEFLEKILKCSLIPY